MSNQKPNKTIAFLLFPELTALDLVGPRDTVNGLRHDGYESVTVAENEEPIKSESITIVPDKTFKQVPNPDILVIPGSAFGHFDAIANESFMNYVKTAAETADLVVSVCTGSLILAAAGLLNGKEATTHWVGAWILEKWGATYVNQRWVKDGKFWTSAGVSAGIDLALELVKELSGIKKGRWIQAALEYNPKAPDWGIDWSELDADEQAEWEQGIGYVSETAQNKIVNSLSSRPDLLDKLDWAAK